MLWVEHDSLSRDVRDQMEKEARRTVCEGCEVSGNVTLPNRTGYCNTWIEIPGMYLEKKLGGLDPSHQAVPERSRRFGRGDWLRYEMG